MSKGIRPRAVTQDVGTGYGREITFHTVETTFTKATEQPVLLLSIRYATRERLLSWGIVIEKTNHGPLAANPFPGAGPSVPPPSGWRG